MARAAAQHPVASRQELHLWVRSMTASLRAINEEQDLRRILDLIAEHACSLLDLSWCTVYTLDEQTQTFSIGGAHGQSAQYDMQVAAKYKIRLSDGCAEYGPPTVRAALTKQTVTVDDVFARPDLEHWWPTLRREGLHAIIATPLRGPDASVVGTITGYAKTAHAFDAIQTAQLDLLSGHAAAAIVAAGRRTRELAANAALRDANQALRRQQEALAAHRDLQQALTKLVLQNAGLARILTFLSEQLDADVYLETTTGVAISDAGWRSGDDALETISAADADRIRAVMESGQAAEVHVTDSYSLVLAPIPRTGAQHQRMWVRRPRRFELDDEAFRALAACAVLIALELSRREIHAQAEARIVRDLLADLLSPATMVHRESFHARASALGHDPHHAYTAVVICPITITTTPNASSDVDVTRIVGRLVEATRVRRPRPVIGGVGGAVVALIPAEASDPAVENFVDLARHVSNDGFRIVVGGCTPSLVEMQSELTVTLRATNLITPNSPAVIYIAKLGVPGLLLETGTTDRMTLFAKQILGTVQQDDMAKSGDLMSTLLTWFSCDMSSRETAQQMFVHPNTIGYRLRRIGELTGLRMTDPGDLMTVRLALDVLQIQGRCVSPGA